MSEPIYLTAGGVLALVLGALIVPKILLISYKKRLFDRPDARKIHTQPIPRLGGLSFFPVMLITVCFMLGLRTQIDGGGVEAAPEFLFFTVGGMLLYLVGVADDLIGVGYRYKFLAQIAAALLMVYPGEWLNTLGGLLGIQVLPPAVGIPFTLFVVVYITNAINLIDGVDGLASGLSGIALFVLGLMCATASDWLYALLAFSALGVVVPFWFFNVFGNARRGHKLFMGDTGSLVLGYTLSLLVIHLSRTGFVPASGNPASAGGMWLAFSTLIVPLFDVVRVVIHRLRNRKNPFLPDKNHFHHKLLRAGLSPRRVMVAILFIALFFIVFNGMLLCRVNANLLLLADIVLWTLLQLAINHSINNRRSASRHPQK